jgi:hypothetical protein
LEVAIDQISRGFAGFWFGRYDIRTPDVAEFQRGRAFLIVELNGATAEATHIYDPTNRLWSAYRTLFTQWRTLWDIAAANAARGARTTSLTDLWRLWRHHARMIRSHGDTAGDRR